MRPHQSSCNLLRTGWGFRSLIFCAILYALAYLPVLTRAGSQAASLTVVNNSALEISHLYLSPADSDIWSADQLSSVISPGHSSTLNNLVCNQGTVKVISEDQNGCFLSRVISCDGSTTWTITNDDQPDCGN